MIADQRCHMLLVKLSPIPIPRKDNIYKFETHKNYPLALRKKR